MNRRAFTLVEIAAVVAIMGIAVTIFVTRVDNVMPGTRLRLAARQVGDSIDLAISDAVMNGKERVIAYYMGPGGMAIQTTRKIFVESAEERGEIVRRNLPEGIEIVDVEGLDAEQDVAIAVVGPSGRVAPHAVHLSGPAGEMTVEVYGVTGRIRYHDGKVLLRAFTREAAK